MEDSRITDTNTLLYGKHKLTGDLLFIDDVKNGLYCDCVCPKCGCLLEARNHGEIRSHSFAHYSEKKAHHKGGSGNTLSNCNVGEETILHLAAKQLFEKSKGLTLQVPEERFGTNLGYPIKVSGSKEVVIDHAEIEKPYGGIIPDITVVTTDGEILFIEVYVTHRTDDTKKNKLKEIGIPCLEIDLNGMCFIDGKIPWDELKRILFYNNAKRKWIYTPALNRLYQKKIRFDKIKHEARSDKPGYYWNDPCILLPSDKRDYFYRCPNCPFFAGEKDIFAYCSAHQLLNMQDIHMDESSVAKLIEQVRNNHIQDYEKQKVSIAAYRETKKKRDIKNAENAISSIGNVSLERKDIVTKARIQYNNLPDESKVYVMNTDLLIAAEIRIDALLAEKKKQEEDDKKVLDVEHSINAIDNNPVYGYFDIRRMSRKDRIYNAYSLFEGLPTELKNRVSNKEELLLAYEKQKTLEEQETERKRIDDAREQERLSRIKAMYDAPLSRRKSIYRNDAGVYMIEGKCPLSVGANIEIPFCECRQCSFCEFNSDITGPNQFIICNGIDVEKSGTGE